MILVRSKRTRSRSAQLALWMRAQKAYRDFGIGRADRAQIRRSNIVVAEPLVADDQIAKEFGLSISRVSRFIARQKRQKARPDPVVLSLVRPPMATYLIARSYELIVISHRVDCPSSDIRKSD